MRKINILIICFLQFFILNSASIVVALELNGPLWAPNCENLKKDYFSDQSFYVIFTKRPDLQNEQNHWVLCWNGIEVLIPKVLYKDIYVSINNRNEYELWLRTIDGVLISLMTDEDKEIKDVFSQTLSSGELITSAEGVLATKDMYGGPVKISTIMMLAYESTPNLLTCSEENRIKESAIAVALILKGTASSDLTAAYRGIGSHDGWITKSKVENTIEYVLNIIPAINDNQLLYITYRIPEGSTYEYLPFWVGSKNQESNETPPNWLTTLNNALESRSNDSWQAFLSAAKQIGISEKSILRTYEQLNLTSEP